MVQRKWGGIILNPGCDNKCLFCKDEVTEASSVSLIVQARKSRLNLDSLKKEGVTDIEISGGDPVAYPNLPRVVQMIKRKGFRDIQLSTHGKGLSDSEYVSYLIESGVSKFRIPIYGSNSQVHEEVTRAKSSFEEAIKGLKTVVEYDVRVQMSTLIMKQNKDDLKNILDLVRSLGVYDFYVSIPCLANDDRSFYLPIKDLGNYLIPLHEYAKSVNYPLKFSEIPHCVFGRVNSDVDNRSGPPKLGEYCQPPKKFKTEMADTPSYRLKKKVDFCKECKAESICDGFFINDLEKYGTGDLEPIK